METDQVQTVLLPLINCVSWNTLTSPYSHSMYEIALCIKLGLCSTYCRRRNVSKQIWLCVLVFTRINGPEYQYFKNSTAEILGYLALCDLGRLKEPLCASVTASVKGGKQPSLRHGLLL